VTFVKYAVPAIALLLGGSIAANQPSATKLDPSLRMALREGTPVARLSTHLSAKAAIDGTSIVDIFVKTTDPVEAEKIIEQWDGSVRTHAGRILTASLPLEYVDDLAALDLIEYIEASPPLQAKLNQSIPLIDADDVHAGTGLSAAYTGSGVLVGIVDTGIDCDHADFTDSSGNTRFLAYWDQTLTTDTTGVSEITNTTGTEYTGTELTASPGCTTSGDADTGTGHGTHVAGIATSNDSTYKGVAPGSKIIAVKHNAQDGETDKTFATTVVDAVNYIFRKAQAQSTKMPAVVNLSLGTSLGAHDGTSLFEQSLDALLVESDGSEKKGRAIVNAAGNENFRSSDSEAASFGGIHATISQTSASKAYDFTIRSGAALVAFYGGVAQVDIWLTADSACTIQLDAYPISSKAVSDIQVDMSPVSKGGSTTGSSNTDSSSAIQLALDFTDSSNANNSKQHARATITKVGGTSANLETFSFDLLFIGTCEGDVWLYPDVTAYTAFRKASALSVTTHERGYTYTDGDSDKTITMPGTANKIITVGSFMGVGTWTDINGNITDETANGGSVGAISLFSSLGPAADSRIKPELVAPGEPIIATTPSTISASDKGDATHHALEGSSMAAPHVTGAIALMLERNGCLTFTEIKDALINTVSTDASTGTGSSVPNNTYGYGKLDVDAAVAAVTAQSCEPNNAGDAGTGSSLIGSSSSTTSNDTSGGGGCAFIPHKD
jgi:minor extracellular serine protease Vpr